MKTTVRNVLFSASLLLSVLLSTLASAQEPSYSFTTIDVPGAAGTFSGGINAQGQIIGFYKTGARIPSHGFLYDRGEFTTLDVPFSGAIGTEAHGINDN